MTQEELKELYSNNLKIIKKKLNLTSGGLAEKLSMPVRTIGSYERQENLCSAQLVTELCKKLNINANWFVTGEGVMFNSFRTAADDIDFEMKVAAVMKKYGVIK